MPPFDPAIDYVTDSDPFYRPIPIDSYTYRTNRLAEDLVTELRETFTTSKLWDVEKVLGHGADGVTVLLKYSNPLRIFRHWQHRVVLKRSLRPGEKGEVPQDLELEAIAYSNLSGNAHIAQMLAYCPDVSRQRAATNMASKFWQRVTRNFQTPVNTVFPSLSPFAGPAILLEYMEHGALVKMQGRVHEEKILLPNRILWGFYFCFIRACVGMAYPKRARLGAKTVLETIPDGEPEQFSLIHGDIASRNILVDSPDPSGPPEHRIVPLLKLIDFGRARGGHPEQPEDAVVANLFACSSLIFYFIIATDSDPWLSDNSVHEGIRTLAVDILPEYSGVNPIPELDVELRDLLIQAMAVDPAQRPSLKEMFERTERGMRKGPMDFPGREAEESDEAITALLQRLLYDA